MNHLTLSQHFDLLPMLRIAIPLMLGIAMSGYLPAVSVGMWMSGVILMLCLALSTYRWGGAQTTCIMLCVLSLGGFLTAWVQPQQELPHGDRVYDAVVLSQPVKHGRTVWMQIMPTTGEMSGKTVSASLLCDTVEGRYLHLSPGMGIEVKSEMEPLTPSKFQSHDVSCQTFIYYANWQSKVVSLRHLSVWQRTRIAALRFRSKLVERYQQMGMEGQALAVVEAMTLGDKSALSHDTKEAYQLSGASHVLALSGLHLSIIYVLLSMLTFGSKKRLWSELLLLTAIWSYSVMVGLMPSVVRAAMMITIYSAVGLAGRPRMSLNVLAFVAVVMLCANPLTLYDISFQLSFMAVAFIMIFQQPVSEVIPADVQQRHPVLKWVWQLTVLSCMAQLGTAPLVAYYFGRLPLYFLLTNLIVIPGATLVLYFSVAIVALAWWHIVQQMVVTVLMLIVSALNIVLDSISRLPMASIAHIRVNGIQVVLIYVVIFACALLLRLLFSSCSDIQKEIHPHTS